MERRAVQKKRRKLNQEIEKKQERTDRQENRPAINSAARGPGQTAHEACRAGLAGKFFAETVKLGANRVANEAAPHRAKFIIHPYRNIELVQRRMAPVTNTV
jgi:hypothetical protein